ncbi:MAG: hypothetical protein M1828_002299 [Chrysothrix sp. TS-e1954]|nr:MAG: hypothetical protein M1828_002299 [Chrysothrix sp. TS-e1954]
MFHIIIVTLLSLLATTHAWLPGSSAPIRGVNLGSLFVFEPWMASKTWAAMGCGNATSEFDCGLQLGQAAVNKTFQQHWNTFITQADIRQIVALGLNTIRIPVGYWMYEAIVDKASEPFPEGSFSYLRRLCGWASDAGLYVIIDLHGAPGAQAVSNAFTGQMNPTPGFYNEYNYERAVRFLEWMTQQIHTTHELRNVGMLEVVNEPLQAMNAQTTSMRMQFYPAAFARVRNMERNLGVKQAEMLHLQMMNTKWGGGDPHQYLPDDFFAAYDDHRYVKWAPGQAQSKAAYLQTSCHDDRGGNWPTIVSEFSLSAPTDDAQQWSAEWRPDTNKAWYLQWFKAQARAYEKTTMGWIFWSWKAELGDPRWSYTDAVDMGLIPRNLSDVHDDGACGSTGSTKLSS